MTDAPPPQAKDDRSIAHVAHGTLRGTVAAMAMTGLRAFTISVGLVDEPPPRAILRQKSRGLYRLAPKAKRRAAQELKRLRPLERLALIADHLLYGFVLSETRRTPRE